MSDQEIQRLLRQWRETGTKEDEARYHAALARLGPRPGDTVSLPDGTQVQVYLWQLPDGTDYEMV